MLTRTSAASGIHITSSVQKGLDTVFGYLPNIVGFLVIERLRGRLPGRAAQDHEPQRAGDGGPALTS